MGQDGGTVLSSCHRGSQSASACRGSRRRAPEAGTELGGEVGQVAVVPVDQRLGQHVRAGDGELQRLRGERLRPRAGERQVERAAADRSDHRARRARAERHAVGLGMVDVEAVELAVADEVEAGLCSWQERRWVDLGTLTA
ncbi:MAG: hypothetical protein ACK5PW_06920 [Burkholderiales bacterium]